MSVDTLSLLQKQISEERMTTEVALTIAGRTDLLPDTEHGWVLYNVNNHLRRRRFQKETTLGENALGAEDAVKALEDLADKLKLTE